jgi:hypothetical protein
MCSIGTYSFFKLTSHAQKRKMPKIKPMTPCQAGPVTNFAMLPNMTRTANMATRNIETP